MIKVQVEVSTYEQDVPATTSVSTECLINRLKNYSFFPCSEKIFLFFLEFLFLKAIFKISFHSTLFKMAVNQEAWFSIIYILLTFQTDVSWL